MIKKIICCAALFISTAAFASAQTPSPLPMATPEITPTPISLETILTEAQKQTDAYREAFKDLLATETKTFEEYDKNGELDERSIIESNFLVYQSPKNPDRSSELRNVLRVDEKLIPDSQARADRFLGELEKTKTLEKELEKIQDESLRYDRTIRIIGFTLFEAITLAKNMRPYFDYKLTGEETVEGRTVYVVSYQQTKKSPFVAINGKAVTGEGIYAEYDLSIPGALKKNDIFLRGKLWIDAQTFQIWREERQVTVQSNGVPLVAQETVFEYTPSEFGILVPKRITFFDNNLKKTSKSDNFNAVKDTQVTFDYSKFKKTNVEVQIIDDEP